MTPRSKGENLFELVGREPPACRRPGRMSMRRIRSDCGYTLLELMLVLAVMAAIAGMTWPALMRPWSRSLLTQSAQEFAEQLLETRMRAIEESRVYQVRWQPGTGQYEIRAPHAAVAPEPSRSVAANRTTVADLDTPESQDAQRINTDLPLTGDRVNRTGLDLAGRPVLPHHVQPSLSHDVRFCSPELLLQLTASDGTDSSLEPNPADDRANDSQVPLSQSSSNSAGLPGDESAVTWSDSIWIYPDGHTSNGHWTLVSDDLEQIEVRLRGLTGTVRIGRVTSVPVPDDAMPQDGLPQDAMSQGANSRGASSSTDAPAVSRPRMAGGIQR